MAQCYCGLLEVPVEYFELSISVRQQEFCFIIEWGYVGASNSSTLAFSMVCARVHVEVCPCFNLAELPLGIVRGATVIVNFHRWLVPMVQNLVLLVPSFVFLFSFSFPLFFFWHALLEEKNELPGHHSTVKRVS